MMWHLIKRDWRDLLGDAKYLFIALGVPLLATPLLILLFVGVSTMKSKQESVRQYSYAVNSTTLLPELNLRLEESSSFNWIDLSPELRSGLSQELNQERNQELSPHEVMDLKKEDESYLVDIYIEIDKSDGQFNVALFHRETNPYSELKAKFGKLTDGVASDLRAQRFDSLGIPAQEQLAITDPVTVRDEIVKEQKELVGQHLGTAFNFIIVIWVFTAMMTVAAELVTGEKENKTLETLLVSPLSRTRLGVSKWISLTSVGVFSGFITLFMYYLSLSLVQRILDVEPLEFIMSLISASDVFMLWLLLLPLCFIISGALVLVAINASSLKEYQSAASFLMLLLMAPLMLLITGSLEWSAVVQWLPGVNLVLSNVEVIKGTFALSSIAPILISNGALCLVVYVVLHKLFNSERVLFTS